jgi:uncharacterized membrane-anchored protein
MKSNLLKAFLFSAACLLSNGVLSEDAVENTYTESAFILPELTGDESEGYRQQIEFLSSLTLYTGKIELGAGLATLEVPENYYYLNPEDSKRVLEDAWGNPLGELGLGMLFPAQYTPIDNAAWGVELAYSEEGFVSDEDAGEIDYQELLEGLQADTRKESKYRVEQGYDTLELVGWAEAPYYDAITHKLYWAKEIRFGDMDVNTLNYNVRILGRKGYLLMNFIANIDQLQEINMARDEVLGMANFNDGNLYSQFDPDIDTVAAYGIGGLIAGKVLAKTGMIAMALLALKKFWFVLFLPLLWLKKRLFGSKSAS